MIRGYYTALSGMIAAEQRQDVVTDQIANIDTPGYAGQALGEVDLGITVAASTGGVLGRLGTATAASGLSIDGTPGPIQETGNPTDLAIGGNGLFAVRAPQGTAYTRAGTFHLDEAGRLVTEQGYPVLDAAGRDIVVSGPFSVSPDGTVAGTGQRLAIAAFPTRGLVRLGDTLYASAAPLPAATGVTVQQGALEASNVDLSSALTTLLELQRQFSLNAEAFSVQSDTLTQLGDLGRLK